MTSIEQRYRANLRAIVKDRLGSYETFAQLARDCFHDADTPDTRASNKTARRALEREMDTAPEGRSSEGVKWSTLERLTRGLGCSVKDLFG